VARRKHNNPRPPPRDGIQPDSLFLPPGPWPALLDFLVQRFPAVGAGRWQQRLQQGNVLDSQGIPLTPATPYVPGSRIYYYRAVEAERPVPFQHDILYEDEHLLVADKPHFLPVAPSGPYLQETLLIRLRRQTGLDQLVLLHRLDRETGLVLLSKNPASRDAYHALFREHRLQKIYEAIAPWHAGLVFPHTCRSRIQVAEEFYRRREVPGEPNAVSHIDLIEQRNGLARYSLQPVTGKTHQLRLHMAGLGIPILNDPCYPLESARKEDDFSCPLQLLARSLAFIDPVSGEPRRFDSRQTLILP
jgi:tRNA pseudouridine32 synthase/23S rRNA pseudouridine746 synthase